MAATLGQVIALLELLLPEVAGHHRSAVGIHAMGEVLTSQADPSSLPNLRGTNLYPTSVQKRVDASCRPFMTKHAWLSGVCIKGCGALVLVAVAKF